MPAMTNVTKHLAMLSPRERHTLGRALEQSVREDPNNDKPMTALLWAIYCDLTDVDVAEAELRHDIDRIDP